MSELERQQYNIWAGIEIAASLPLPADASSRTYHRLIARDGQSYILMDCSVDRSSIESFIKIAQLLRSCGISAPKIYEYEESSACLLLEDLGELTIKKFLANHPEQTEQWYRYAVDLLVQVQRIVPPQYLVEHDEARLLRKLQLFSRWYWLASTQHEMPTTLEQQFLQEWQAIFRLLPHCSNVVVLGDFHSENLMYLSKHVGEQSIGVLDFQDAYLGHPVYDLASLLNDARSFIPMPLRNILISYYAEKSQVPLTVEQIELSYNILSAARNMQILGIFARKALRDDAKHYLDMIPRVLGYLRDNLATPALSHMLRFLP